MEARSHNQPEVSDVNPASVISESVLLAHGSSSRRCSLHVYCNRRFHTEKEKKCPLSLCWVTPQWPIYSRKTCFLAKNLFRRQQTNAREKSTEEEDNPFSNQKLPLGSKRVHQPDALPSPVFSWPCCAEIWVQGRAQGGFCGHEPRLDRLGAGAPARKTFQLLSCQVRGQRRGLLAWNPLERGWVLKCPGAGSWAVPPPPAPAPSS